MTDVDAAFAAARTRLHAHVERRAVMAIMSVRLQAAAARRSIGQLVRWAKMAPNADVTGLAPRKEKQ